MNRKTLDNTPNKPLLETADLEKHFRLRGGLFARSAGRVVKAVDGVSLAVWPGEAVGLVGESGSGKSTLGKCLLRILEPTGGMVFFDGQEITHLSPRAMRPLRPHMQMVFQNPYSTVNPSFNI